MTKHAIERAGERYGVILTEADIDMIREDIKSGGALLVNSNLHGTASLYLVKFNGITMKVIYKENGAIITFLPKGK